MLIIIESRSACWALFLIICVRCDVYVHIFRFIQRGTKTWPVDWAPKEAIKNDFFKFAFPGKFLQTNRNVRDLPLLPPFDQLANLQLIFWQFFATYFFVNIVNLFFLIFFGNIFWKYFFPDIFATFFCYSLQLIFLQIL